MTVPAVAAVECLHVFGFAPSPECPRCARSVELMAHVLFVCSRFSEVRAELLIFSNLQGDWREEQLTLAAAAQPNPASAQSVDMAEKERRL